MSQEYFFVKASSVGRLKSEILASNIATTLEGVTVMDGDQLTVRFADVLSGADEVTLNSVVTSHDNTPLTEPDYSRVISLTFGNADGTPLQTKDTTWKRLRSFTFDGTDKYGSAPVIVRVLGFVDPDGAGEFRLYDKTNDVILGTLSGNNTEEGFADSAAFSGWPTDTAIIEVQLRSTVSKKSVYITSMSIVF